MARTHVFSRGTERERDRGLLLLRNLTRGAIVGATALAGIFAGIAAETAKGRSVHAARVVTPRAESAPRPRHAPPPPTAPAVGAAAAAPAPTPAPAPQQAPVPAAAPPVVVSGGS